MKHAFLRFPEVRDAVKLSRATIFRLERDGNFPARRQLGAKSVAWVRQEIDAWINSREAVGSNTATCKTPKSPGRRPKNHTLKKQDLDDNVKVIH
jgi:prophage regulatory protein